MIAAFTGSMIGFSWSDGGQMPHRVSQRMTSGSSLGRRSPAECQATRPPHDRRAVVGFEAVRVLVLGGTSFVGRAIVEDALRTGTEVTLFGRGKTGPDLFPELTRLIGDRDIGDYAALGSGSWDAVVDASGYVPRHVGQ